MVSAVLDALATLPGPILLAVVCAAALLETAVLAGLVLPGRIGWGVVAIGLPVALAVATHQRRRAAAAA